MIGQTCLEDTSFNDSTAFPATDRRVPDFRLSTFDFRPPAMPHPARLAGIFTPNIVPLDDRGDINEPELRRYVDWLIDRGVHGLYPNGSTGEFTRFTAEERRRIIEIIADQTRGRVPILAGAAEANVRETVSACEHYHEIGRASCR